MKKVLIVIGAAKSNMGSQMLLRGISKIVKEQGNTVVSASMCAAGAVYRGA